MILGSEMHFSQSPGGGGGGNNPNIKSPKLSAEC